MEGPLIGARNDGHSQRVVVVLVVKHYKILVILEVSMTGLTEEPNGSAVLNVTSSRKPDIRPG